MTCKRRRLAIRLSIAVACAVAARPAAADDQQSQPQGSPPAGVSGAAVHLEETVVTAPKTTLPLDLPAAVSKTDTPLADLPRSVQIIPRELMDEQGAIRLTDSLRNVSSAAQGGQFAFGFADRVIIRGLNATYLTDDLPDQTSELGGIPHTLTGVERVEVIKGPGSALYGDSEQGGMINLVHFRPADRFSLGASEQFGSFNTSLTNAFVTGPTGVRNVDFRLDAANTYSDGFRDTRQRLLEFLPALSWRPKDHDVEARVESRTIRERPDASGIPFSPPSATGVPADVPASNVYYTPFARGDQDIVRFLLSDAWAVDHDVTVNNRFSFTNRNVSVLRNAGGTVALLNDVYGLKNRQLRRQHDNLNDFVYQLEPQFRFSTGGIDHTLLVGFATEIIDGDTSRATADLPNIADLTHPMVPETSEDTLTFLCDAKHSCNDADIWARFFGIYVVDQIDVTKSLKVRLSVRGDRDTTAGVANANIPVNPGLEQPCNPPQKGAQCPWIQGESVGRTDNLFSWEAGAVYFIVPQFSLFAGAENARYPIFNTEEPESIGGVPERGTQVEGGARLALGPQLALSSSVFEVHRDSVFAVFADPVTGLDVPTTFSYRVQGWETDLNALPVARWYVNANLSLQRPLISDYPQTPSNVGRSVPSDPRILGNVWSDYGIVLPDDAGVLSPNVGLQCRGRSYADAGNTRILPGSALVSTGLGWFRRGVQVAFGVDNLLDQRNYLGGAGTGGGAIPGPGRTVFGRIAFRL